MEMKLELVFLPVADVDKAIDFYVNKIGFNLDHDHQVSPEMRFVQLTPEGSACSISIGTGLLDGELPPVKGLQLVVADARAAHAELSARGVAVSDVDVQPWGTFVRFSDPDGNAWALQEITNR
jgi:catechol 2,3-dioxygenase-like lactoylglutathione lyase family enzyme